MVVIGILGLLVGILAVAVIPKLTEAQNKLEIKQVGDIMSGFQNIAADGTKRAKLSKDKKVKDTKGAKFYEAAFKYGILDESLISKVVGLNSTDVKAGTEWLEGDAEMPANSVSYTAPKASKLMEVMKMKGKQRTIILTFNSRNWANYGDKGVIVQWSDNQTAEYLTIDQAVEDPWNLDEKAWNENPQEIIGEKAPFDHTYE